MPACPDTFLRKIHLVSFFSSFIAHTITLAPQA